jgi:hypothetical protein
LWLVRIVFWLQAFAGPVILFGLIAFLIYNKTENLTVAVILLSIGIINGILLVEFIRRKYGLESFLPEFTGQMRWTKKTNAR